MPEPSNRPSVVLHGFTGGIVGSATAAVGLAEVMLASRMGRRDLANCLPLLAQDLGDRWLVSSAAQDVGQLCNIEIRKLDAALLSFGVETPSEVLDSAATTKRIAEILVENASGSGELSRQLPFIVIDRGDTWLVRGSRNAERTVEGAGSFHLELRKRDGGVLEMYFVGVLHTPQEVLETPRGKI